MILLVSAHFPPEPVTAATLCYDLAKSLSKDHKVKVISPAPSRPLGFNFKKEKQVNNGNFEHELLKSYTYPKSTFTGRMYESYSFGIHAAKYIKENNSCIKSVYVLAWPLLAQYLIVRMCQKLSIPCVTHVMDIYPESLANKLPAIKNIVYHFLLPIDKYILQKSDWVITISSNMRKRLINTRKLNNNRVKIVHTWQNDEIFFSYKAPQSQSSNDSSFTFMFLGCLSKSAALEIVIKAFKKSKLKNARLVIAGNGSEKEYLISLTKNHPNKNIEFRDAPLHQVPMIQDQADVLILGLRKNTAHFAMPSKLPAYMFSKKPVIASVEENSATANAIKKANCGWTVTPEDTDKLKELLQNVISIPKEKLNWYGKNGFSFAEENFSKHKNLNKLVSLIKETL
jgi:glycosyltransferase involved in cell wall biosynthesis